MKSIGMVTYRKSPKATPSDQLLVKPLAHFGFSTVAVPWDDPQVDWKQFDILILRSCWNYHQKYGQFLSWLKTIELLRIPVWNPIPVLRWNVNKTYLLDFERNGIPIIPTVIIGKQQRIQLAQVMADQKWPDVVVKPVIGASADNIFRTQIGTAPNAQQLFSDMLTVSDVIIQPYINEITEGEFSLIFIGGIFSHAVLKRPKRNEYRTNYRFGGKWIRVNPQPALLNAATTVLHNVTTPLLYARVDGIIQNGTFLLMELELTDPHLFFDLDPASPKRFAEAVSLLTTG